MNDQELKEMMEEGHKLYIESLFNKRHLDFLDNIVLEKEGENVKSNT